jgi:uncharacterized membrane protein YjjB (DUF3815 family)
MLTLLAVASIYWDFPILLIVVSLVYSATRHDRWSLILREALGWMVRMTLFLGSLGVVLYLLSTFPKIWPYAAGAGAIGMVIYYASNLPWLKKKTPTEVKA